MAKQSKITLAASTAMLAVAVVCHEANRAWCAVNGDETQLPWADAPEWQRDSALKGVEFSMANPDAPASLNHDAWTAEKLADGWKFGEVKDPEAKTHPCLVPFEDLPPVQQAKDRLFKAIVGALREPQPEAPAEPAILEAIETVAEPEPIAEEPAAVEVAHADEVAAALAPQDLDESTRAQLQTRWDEIRHFVSSVQGDASGDLGELLAFVRSKL